VTVYAIGLYRAFPDEAALGRQLLQDMADSTGGLYLEAGGPRDLPKIISKIDIRNEYVLGMTPAGLQADGKDHNVNLKLERDARTRKLRASWRRGYYAVGDIALPKFSLR
jgi:hypothetical protein